MHSVPMSSCFVCREPLWPSHDFVVKTSEGTRTVEPVACFNPDCTEFTQEYEQTGNMLCRLNREFEGMTVSDIVAKMGISLDRSIDLGTLVQGALTKFPDQVKLHRSGKKDLSGFLVGQIMREHSNVDPKSLREALVEALR